MKTKRTMVSTLILVCALALAACGSEKTPETTQAPTVAVTVVTTAPTETAAPAQPLELTDWSMSAATWSSPNGATINISAVPNYYEEGQKADFVVRLENEEITSIPCQWDGTNYTASADLNAADGYCYYVVLTSAEGTVSEVAVNTPDAPTNEAFINMETSLVSYCTIIMEESIAEGNQLTLYGGKVQIQIPTITNEGETITCQEAALVLLFGEEEADRKVLTLTETSTAGLWEASLDGLVFNIPEMEDYQKVELVLNAALTNDQVLSAYGGSWQANADGFLPVLG